MKMLALPDTHVVDDPEGYRMSKAETTLIQAGIPPMSTSVEPSLARSAKKERSKLSKDEGALTVTLPAEGSAYSDPSFVKEVTEAFRLLADHKRLNEIGPVQSTEWSLAYTYQLRWFCMSSLELHLWNFVKY